MCIRTVVLEQHIQQQDFENHPEKFDPVTPLVYLKFLRNVTNLMFSKPDLQAHKIYEALHTDLLL